MVRCHTPSQRILIQGSEDAAVVPERMETVGQQELLRSYKCDAAQVYLFCRSILLGGFISLFKSRDNEAVAVLELGQA